MDVELWIFITAGCLFSCAVGSVATYVAVNWSRDRQEEADQQRRENAIEHGLKLAQDVQQLEQRISGDTPAVDDEWAMARMVGMVDPLAFAASVGREHAAIAPPAMTGVRDVDAQDRELTEVFGIGDQDAADVVGWCGQFDDEGVMCGRRAASCIREPHGDVLLCAEHFASAYGCPEAGGCRRPDQCETGCHWLRLRDLNRGVASPVDDDPADTLPRVLPEGRVSD